MGTNARFDFVVLFIAHFICSYTIFWVIFNKSVYLNSQANIVQWYFDKLPHQQTHFPSWHALMVVGCTSKGLICWSHLPG